MRFSQHYLTFLVQNPVAGDFTFHACTHSLGDSCQTPFQVLTDGAMRERAMFRPDPSAFLSFEFFCKLCEC